MRAIAYRRVSTEEQGSDGLGMAAQTAAVQQYLTAGGITDALWVEDVCSGKTAPEKRAGLSGALDMLASGERDILVVPKLDRLSRSVIDFSTMIETADRQGWSIVILDCQVDTSTPAGRMMAHVLASFAQFERELISDRTKKALAGCRERGQRLGRPTLCPPETVAKIEMMRSKGMSYSQAAGVLNRAGIPTPTGKDVWYAASVRSVALRVNV